MKISGLDRDFQKRTPQYGMINLYVYCVQKVLYAAALHQSNDILKLFIKHLTKSVNEQKKKKKSYISRAPQCNKNLRSKYIG